MPTGLPCEQPVVAKLGSSGTRSSQLETELAAVPNMLLTERPKTVRPAIQTRAMRTTISAYSMTVAPSSSRTKDLMNWIKGQPFASSDDKNSGRDQVEEQELESSFILCDGCQLC